MRIAILGVGYLGQQIASYLERAGIKPLFVSRHYDKVCAWQSEGLDTFLLRPSLKSSWLSLAFHADGIIVTVAPSNGASYEETYLQTAVALTKTEFKGPLLYCSSTSVYGEKEGAVVDEQSPLNPLTSSAKTLAAAEEIYLRAGGTIVRIGQLWGPGRRIEAQLSGKTEFAGDGQSMTNLTEVSDAARAFVFLLQNRQTGLFNVCGKSHTPRKEFYEALARKYELPPPSWDRAKLSIHGGSKIVSSEKICKLGFVFHHDVYD